MKLLGLIIKTSVFPKCIIVWRSVKLSAHCTVSCFVVATVVIFFYFKKESTFLRVWLTLWFADCQICPTCWQHSIFFRNLPKCILNKVDSDSGTLTYKEKSSAHFERSLSFCTCKYCSWFPRLICPGYISRPFFWLYYFTFLFKFVI